LVWAVSRTAKAGRKADVFHCNEGHAAMIGLERITELMNDAGLTYAEAKEVVRASTLFTTHTPFRLVMTHFTRICSILTSANLLPVLKSVGKSL
jgi:glucan phosphorylase